MNAIVFLALFAAVPTSEHTTWSVKTPGYRTVTRYAPATAYWYQRHPRQYWYYSGQMPYQDSEKYYYYERVYGTLADVSGSDVTIMTSHGTEIFKYGNLGYGDQQVVDQFRREHYKQSYSIPRPPKPERKLP